MAKKDIVVKSDRLNTVVQNLSLVEFRLIQLAIVDARETGKGLSPNKPLTISADRYAKAFGTTKQNAYQVILEAEKTLFDRRFTLIDDGKKIKSRWIQDISYLNDLGCIQLTFTRIVVDEITALDGSVNHFTQYFLEETKELSSIYSARLYELLIQWRTSKTTPVFELQLFRNQLGIHEETEYARMSDFKKRVLDTAVNEINDKTNIKVSYSNEKQGKRIIGFKFKIKEKHSDSVKDKNIDLFTGTTKEEDREVWRTKGLSEGQISKLWYHKEVFATLNSHLTEKYRGGHDELFESWKPMLKDPELLKQFKGIKEVLSIPSTK